MAHQRAGIERFKAAPSGGLLFDWEMGCGKSAAAILAIAETVAQRTLLICPLAVAAHWEREIAKWWPRNLTVPLVCNITEGHKLKRRERYLAACALARETGVPLIVIVNYDVVALEPLKQELARNPWDVVIADECHRLKSNSGRQSKAAAKLTARRRLGLSGTPMPHSPLDAFGVMRFIEPRALGGFWTVFRAEYAVMGGPTMSWVKGFKNTDKLAAKLAPYFHSVKSADVLDLPESSDMTVPVRLDAGTLRVYKDFETELIAELADGVMTASNALVKLLRLAQLTGGVVTPDDETAQRVSTEKQDALEDVLADVPMNEPVVVFCRFVADLDAVATVAQNLGREYRELSGRKRELDTWQTESCGSVLGVQIQAGGVGVDLTRARICAYYSIGYSLGDYLQSRARVLRPGQTRNVLYYHLSAVGTVDEKIMAALAEKKNILESVAADMRRIGL